MGDNGSSGEGGLTGTYNELIHLNGIFDAETAQRFRHEILEVGGSRDFMRAYVDFRGRKPEIDALLRQSGIVTE